MALDPRLTSPEVPFEQLLSMDCGVMWFEPTVGRAEARECIWFLVDSAEHGAALVIASTGWTGDCERLAAIPKQPSRKPVASHQRSLATLCSVCIPATELGRKGA